MKCVYKKRYVSVNINIDEDGNVRPQSIIWHDGHLYSIDRILHACKASSTKVGGSGMRYTVMIDGKETFLYDEGEKWFVEAKEYVS